MVCLMEAEKIKDRDLNCRAGSYKNKCGIETCYRVTGERCGNHKLHSSNCHPQILCVENLCRGNLFYGREVWLNSDIQNNEPIKMQLTSNKKRNQFHAQRFPSFNNFDENSYENKIYSEELQMSI